MQVDVFGGFVTGHTQVGGVGHADRRRPVHIRLDPVDADDTRLAVERRIGKRRMRNDADHSIITREVTDDPWP